MTKYLLLAVESDEKIEELKKVWADVKMGSDWWFLGVYDSQESAKEAIDDLDGEEE